MVEGFEIDNVYVAITGAVPRILKGVDGVSEIRKRRLFSRWDGIHVWFMYRGCECIVEEPFGDNSRYWIGSGDPAHRIPMTDVENAFARYRPPFLVKVIGDLISLDFKSLIGK